jgi:uncharacterized protein YdiU (UPF0061 family)
MNKKEALESIKSLFENELENSKMELNINLSVENNAFELCQMVFNSTETKTVTMSEISTYLGLGEKQKSTISRWASAGSVFAQFDGFAGFCEDNYAQGAWVISPREVRELTQDRKLGVKGLRELAELSGVDELIDNLVKAKNQKPKTEKKTQNRAKKENSPAVTIEKALETLLTFIENADDIEKLNAVRNALIVAINKRAEKEKAKAA